MKHETQSNRELPSTDDPTLSRSWPPCCDRCKAQLTEPGAVVLSPPMSVKEAPAIVTNLVLKFHVCVRCYHELVGWLVHQIGEQR